MRVPRLVLVGVLTLGIHEAALAEESPQFAELFGDEAKAVAATASKQDDIDFASKLLTSVERLKDDPVLQGTLCQKAYEAASSDPSGYGLAVTALDRFASIYPDRKDVCDQTALILLERQYKSARPSERRLRVEPYLQRLSSMADRKIESGDLNAALTYLRVAASVAGTGPQAASLTARATSVAERQEVEKRISELRAKHEAEPKNESVLRTLIEYIAVEKGDGKELTELVPAIEDEVYRRLIEDISRPIEDMTEDQALKVAEWWTAHVASTTSLGRARASSQATAAWKRFLSLHEKQDAARLKAELNLRRLGSSVAVLDSPPATTVAPTPPPAVRPGPLPAETAPKTSRTKPLKAAKTLPALSTAQVQPSQGAGFVELRPGSNVWPGDGEWDDIPEELAGLMVWQNEHEYQGVSEFTVKADGQVALAVRIRPDLDRLSPGDWKKDCKTLKQLAAEGWHETGLKLTMQHRGSSSEWLVVIRDCKQREQFSVRSDKYSAPVVIATK